MLLLYLLPCYAFPPKSTGKSLSFCLCKFCNEHKINLKIWNSKQAERKNLNNFNNKKNHEIYSSSYFLILIPLSSNSIPISLYFIFPGSNKLIMKNVFIPHIVLFCSLFEQSFFIF